jgi:hypothetical protein
LGVLLSASALGALGTASVVQGFVALAPPVTIQTESQEPSLWDCVMEIVSVSWYCHVNLHLSQSGFDFV